MLPWQQALTDAGENNVLLPSWICVFCCFNSWQNDIHVLCFTLSFNLMFCNVVFHNLMCVVVRDFPWNPHLWQATPCWCHPWYHVVWRVRQSPAPIWCQREGHQYYLRGASTLSTERTACFSNSLCTLYLVFSQRLGTACDSIILKFSGCLIQYWFVGYFQDLV